MRRKIPSNLALEAFESAARHQSFTKAALELSVTQSAVCRRVAGLETFLGVKLFRRTRRGIVLTEAGVNYSPQVAAQLDAIEHSAVELMSNGARGGTLEVAVSPTFANRWLMPRLSVFMAAHPDIFINLTSRTSPFLFEDTPFDAAIYAGNLYWPSSENIFLMHESLVAVASPKLIASRGIVTASEIGQMRLLQLGPRPHAWRLWFNSLGLRFDNDLSGPRMELYSMLIEAAVCSMGVALVPRFLIEDELHRGLLVELLHHRYLSQRSFYLIYPQQKAESPILHTFRAWLKKEAHAYRTSALI